MKAKRSTKIKIETFESTKIQLGKSRNYIFCNDCQTITTHFSIEQTMQIFELDKWQIDYLIENQQIHLRENENGLLLLCSNSLANLKL